MKTIAKVMVSILALGVVVLVGLHLFMHYGLTKAMRDVVLPRVKQELGVEVQVERLSLNLPGGIMYIKGVSLKNPEGYPLDDLARVDEIYVEVDVGSLIMQKPIVVHKVQMKNALVTVVRNKEKRINVKELQDALPAFEDAPSETPRDVPAETPPSTEMEPLPEIVIQSILCNARVRYLDQNHEDRDFALDLSATARGLSTQRTQGVAWGTLALTGALSSDRTSFQTDLDVRLAPITNPQRPSFDLKGEIMRIDPRILERLYKELGIRCAPFSVEPDLHCRGGVYERSSIALELREVELEDQLARKLGGMASIGSLRLAVPVGGSFQKPKADVQSAFLSAMGDNAKSVLGALITGAVGKELGATHAPTNLVDAAVEILGQHVDEVGEHDAAKKILKGLAGGGASDTNTPSAVGADELIDLLGDSVKEIGENEELKQGLKNLGKTLFGK